MAKQIPLNKRREQAKQLVEAIQEDAKYINEVKLSIKSVLDQLEGYKEEESEIGKIVLKIQSALEKVEQDEKSISDLLLKAVNNNTEIQTFFDEEFQSLKADVEDEDSGIQACIDDYARKWKDLIVKHDEIVDLYDSCVLLKSNYEDYLSKIEGIEKEFNTIRDKIYDEDDGILNVLSNVRGVKNQVDDLYNKIAQNQRDSSEIKNRIKEFESEAKSKLKSIKDVDSEAVRLKDKIDEIYGIATVNGQGGYFDKTKKELINYRNMWMVILFASVVITVIVAVYITLTFKEKAISFSNNETANLIIRYSLLSPLIYIIVFCGKQFKIARLSVEQYTYKTVVSFSLESEILFLQDKFGKSNAKIMEFALTNLEKLYSEPFHDDQKEFDNEITLLKAKNQAKKEQADLKFKSSLAKHGAPIPSPNGHKITEDTGKGSNVDLDL